MSRLGIASVEAACNGEHRPIWSLCESLAHRFTSAPRSKSRRASATRRSGGADIEQAMSRVHPYSSYSFIHARPPSGLPSSHALTASKSPFSAAVAISAGRTIYDKHASARLLNWCCSSHPGSIVALQVLAPRAREVDSRVILRLHSSLISGSSHSAT